MRRWLIAGITIAAAAIGLAGSDADGQSAYPSRPLTLVIPYGPGGGTDTSGRIFAKWLSQALDRQVVVINKSGGNLGVVQVVQSKPDGYTLGYISDDLLTITPQLEEVPAYDAFKDLVPVAHLLTSYTMLVASTSFPANSLAEAIAYAKQNPGKVTVASTGVGTWSHLLGELFKQAAGIETTHVPYANTASASVDLIAGRLDLMFHSTPAEIIGAGRAKGLAAVGTQRMKSLPDVPTMSEVLPSYRGSDNGWTLAAPAGTPVEIVKKLSDAIASFGTSPDYIKVVESRGFVVSFSPYDQVPKQLHEQHDAYGDAIRQGNIKIHN